MAGLKYSRQREAVQNYLLSTKEHPTADMVYMHVRKEFPNISLGTVYRNLNLLAAEKKIIKIASADGGDRFDGDTSKHHHFFCSSCGRVLDLNLELDTQIRQIVNKGFDGVIDSYDINFYGTCGDCLQN